MAQGRKLTIGEAARTVGVSTKAIRLWEAKGLLPLVDRTEAGYRVFTSVDLSVLRFIHQAKALGLTLTEIKDVIGLQRAGTVPCKRVTQLIDAHIADIDRVLADLHQLRQTLMTVRGVSDLSPRVEDALTVCSIIENATSASSRYR